MEYKSKITLIAFYHIIFLVVTSCGYFESDGVDYEETIVGHVKLQKQENSTVTNLVFSESDEIYAGLVENCAVVFYDSLSDKIYAEKFLNEWNSTFYEIIVLDTSSRELSNAIKKKTISKDAFLKKGTRDGLVKWDFRD